MRDTIIAEISELERQVQAYTDQLEQTDERTPKYEEIKVALEKTKVELAAKQAEQVAQEREQAIEEKVHSEITFAIPGVDFTTLPVELITVIHAVVKADRRKNLSEHLAEFGKLEREYDAYKQNAEGNYNGLLANHNLLEQEYEAAARDLKEQTAETVRVIAERDDARANRDNAARQLEEAKAEIARLESQIDDYQKAKVLGERQAQAVIDVTPTEADEINAAIKNLFVKSENWGSVEKLYLPDGTFKVVKRDELPEWTAITPPPLLGGSETQAETFQGEDTKVDVIDSGVLASEVPTLVFPSEEESNASGLPVDENGTLRSDDEPVTWKNLKALEARIEDRLLRLEQSAVAVA